MLIGRFFTDVLGVNDMELCQKLMSMTEVLVVKKGQKIVNFGERPEKVTFLLKGIFRGYILNSEGKEITECFGFQPGDVAVSCCGLDQPSPICIQALTDCQVLCLPVSDCVEIIQTNLEMMAIYSRFLQKALQTHWEIKNAMYQYQALERYQWFLRNYPNLDEQVNSRYIASFLSITPVTPSRLRRWLKGQADHHE